MEWAILGRLVLATARHYLFAQGDHEAVEYIDGVGDAWAAGHNVDNHLAQIAAFLEGGGRPDFAAQRAALQAEVDQFLAPDPAT